MLLSVLGAYNRSVVGLKVGFDKAGQGGFECRLVHVGKICVLSRPFVSEYQIYLCILAVGAGVYAIRERDLFCAGIELNCVVLHVNGIRKSNLKFIISG